MGDDENKWRADVTGVFARVRQLPLEPDPHLATRVVARWNERRRAARVAPAWRWIGIGASTLATVLAAVLAVGQLRTPTFDAFVGRPFVVKLEVKDLGDASIAKARIRLPAGVYFDVDGFPELRDQRELTLAWQRRDEKEFIPFVLTAVDEGTKTIEVDFYDANDVLVGTKRVAVRMKKVSG